MPELTLTLALTWFGVLAGAASVAAVLHGWMGQRQTTRLQADIHAATQLTLTDMRKGFSESQQTLGEAAKGIGEAIKGISDGQQRLGEAVKGIGAGHTALGQILARMEERAAQSDQRWQEAVERMDQRADERHREVIQAIQALKG